MALACTDFSAPHFSDERLRQRFRCLLCALDARPGCSLPQACQSPAALKGAYRFVDHPETTVENLLPAFVTPSVTRAHRGDLVLAVHDTASFNFSTLRTAQGLGYLNDSPTAQGLHLHSSLLLDADCRLLGIAHLNFWVRSAFRAKDGPDLRTLPIEQKESLKWLTGIRATAQVLAGGPPTRRPRVIHVLDREGDIHEVFAEIRRLGHEAVIRCAQDRRVGENATAPTERAKGCVAKSRALGTLQLRVPKKNGGYRTALVQARCQEVRLSPDPKKRPGRRPLKLWLIEVREVSTPPAGEKAAAWWLWTTLPCRTLKRVRRVLAIYKARWRVEEYHRVLKTGCAVERLRLDSAAKLMKVIAMKAWVATRIVGLRDAGKSAPQQSCQECFAEAEWKLLWTRHHQRAWQAADGVPTLEDVLKWLGQLGGHLGRKGDGLPGAERLTRGLYALELLLEGQQLATLQSNHGEAEAPPHRPSTHPTPRG